MTPKIKIGSILLYVVGALFLVLGAAGFIASVIPPNIEQFIGKKHDEWDPNMVQLIFMFVKTIGVLYIAIGTAIIILTARIAGIDAKGSSWTIAVLLFPVMFIPLILLPLGLAPPMFYIPVVFILTAIALILINKN
jgi:hypothetical protein